MRAVMVELSRFRSRRAIALMLIAAALLAALMAASTLWDTRPVSAAERAHAQAMADRDAASPGFQEELAHCQEDPESYNGPGTTADQCAEMMTPQADWYLSRGELSLENVNRDAGLGLLLLVSGIMVVVGTTFAGADWASGSMSNQLLFQPRRARVWAAKGAAVLIGTMLATAVIITAFWVVMFVAADARGIATGATVQETIRATAGRGVLLAGFGALGAYALTMLLRHTVGTLAVLFAYAVGGTAVIAALPFAGVGRWSVGNNVAAWLQNGYEYYDSSIVCSRGQDMCDQTATLTLAQGSTYFGVLLVAVALLSLVLFRRRDIP